MKQECMDCNKEISEGSIRCKSCSNRNRTGTFKWNKGSIKKRFILKESLMNKVVIGKGIK